MFWTACRIRVILVVFWCSIADQLMTSCDLSLTKCPYKIEMIDTATPGFITPNLVCPSVIHSRQPHGPFKRITLCAFRIVLILLVNKYNYISVNFIKPAHLECWLLFYDNSDKTISKLISDIFFPLWTNTSFFFNSRKKKKTRHAGCLFFTGLR